MRSVTTKGVFLQAMLLRINNHVDDLLYNVALMQQHEIVHRCYWLPDSPFWSRPSNCCLTNQ